MSNDTYLMHQLKDTSDMSSLRFEPLDSIKAAGQTVEWVNYNHKREWCENATFRAWGYLAYNAPLTQKQIDDYELRAAEWLYIDRLYQNQTKNLVPATTFDFLYNQEPCRKKENDMNMFILRSSLLFHGSS